MQKYRYYKPETRGLDYEVSGGGACDLCPEEGELKQLPCRA